MANKLNNKKVAILVTDGFEESEFVKPLEALRAEEAKVDVISLKSGSIKAWKDKDWGSEYPVDKTIDAVNANEYDALVLPGGVMNPDQLRMDEKAVSFVSSFMVNGKPVAAICHGPWTLLETGLLKGKTVTSWPSLKTDLTNAGARWVDQEVVVDHGLVTSRKPDDLPAFCKKMIEEIGEGVHSR
ncbi:MAG: type 1 glutamine amidotransferase domain-containing protein [Chitinophagales bacterium]